FRPGGGGNIAPAARAGPAIESSAAAHEARTVTPPPVDERPVERCLRAPVARVFVEHERGRDLDGSESTRDIVISPGRLHDRVQPAARAARAELGATGRVERHAPAARDETLERDHTALERAAEHLDPERRPEADDVEAVDAEIVHVETTEDVRKADIRGGRIARAGEGACVGRGRRRKLEPAVRDVQAT